MPTTPEITASERRVRRIAKVPLPTRFGLFDAVVYADLADGSEPLALVRGDPADGEPPLVRVHSECLTGDVLGSLRCDCGEQLNRAMAAIAADGRGVLIYLRQEGRGIGLTNKLRAYALQDDGLDTVDANAALGLPVDAREYGAAAAILADLGVQRLRLMTNNPDKVAAMDARGMQITERIPIAQPPNPINRPYLDTKARRLGHAIDPGASPRPLVTVHYAQTLDGRLATRTGDSQWISGEPSLRLAHGLRASHEAVAVGIGTVLADDPRLTVRLVPGASPLRIVVDSALRVPPRARLLTDGAAPTLVATTRHAAAARRRAIEATGVEVLTVDATADGRVDLAALLDELGARRISSLLVEGGASLITAMLRGQHVHRLVVSIAPMVVGDGIEAVGDLDVHRLRDALTFRSARFSQVGPDVVFDGELEPSGAGVA
ncbi:MAG TPA: GTP cyclohydrolase II [Candidatus Limnocylindria bacterium]|nr:GTP cyclohydrolase II [Candidatus Limnocylindria bacterium]